MAVPDVFGLRRAAGQIIVDLDRLVERLQRVVEDGQVQRALGHLGFGLRAKVLGFSGVVDEPSL